MSTNIFTVGDDKMDNGIYVALSRQTGLFRQMNVIANNIANVNTTGYQAERVMFDDYLVEDGNHEDIAYSQDVSSYRSQGQGPINTTGNPLDVAINGKGFFVVETAQGERYSRAGNFSLDAEGTMITPEGFPVLDEGGQRIQFAPGDKEIRIGENGVLVVDGNERGALGLVEFENPQLMKQTGYTMYETNQEPLPPTETRLVHGAVEASNVSAVKEMVDMTIVGRSASGTAKYIEVMYDLQRRAHDAYSRASQG